jgi:YD repeat-containing protein
VGDHLVTVVYDLLGRPTVVTDHSDGGVTQYFYGTTSGGNCTSCSSGGGIGKIAAVIMPEGNRLDYDYDNVGNLRKITDDQGNSIVYTYDRRRNRTSEKIFDPAGALQKTLSYQYDLLNRLARIVQPDEGVTEHGYDSRGHRRSVKNPNGHTTTYENDAAGRLDKVTQSGEIVTSYTHDRRGNTTSVTDDNGNTTIYEYDEQDRLVKTTSPDTGITTYTYDLAGNIKTKTDAKGVTATYSYDSAGRLTAINWPDPVDDVIYDYDECPNGKGRLCTMIDPSGTTTYQYTLKGQIAREIKLIGGQIYTIEYSYDKNGNPASLKYPTGRVVTYSYANDRVTSVLADGAAIATDITYMPFGGINSFTYGNGIQHSAAYDRQYRITRLIDSSVQDKSYAYDQQGNITGIEDLLDPTRRAVLLTPTMAWVTALQKPTMGRRVTVTKPIACFQPPA